MLRNFISLLRDEHGTSVVELALLTPVFATLVIGTIDLSTAYSEKLRLEQASQRAIEKVMQLSANGTTAGTLRTEAATTADVPESDVTVTYWLECDGVKVDDYGTTCSPGQTYARYLSVEIEAEYEPFFPLKTFGANADGNYDVVGKAGLRTQ